MTHSLSTAATTRLRRNASLCLLILLVTTTQVMARNVALLVGVGKYANPHMAQLSGPPEDLRALRERLVSRLQFKEHDIQTLQDSAATREGILAALDKLMQRSAPGDNVLIYYSGHGTSAGDRGNALDLPYATGAWIPHDVAYNSRSAMRESVLVGRRDLLPRLRRLDEGGRFVLVLTDSCYSGQLVRSASHDAPLRLLPAPAAEASEKSSPTTSASGLGSGPRNQPPPYPYKNVLMLSASSDSEAAVDLSCPPGKADCNVLKRWPTVDGKPHGAFTDALLRLLDGELPTKGEASYIAVRQALANFLASRGIPQEPQVLPSIAEDSSQITPRSFMGMLLNTSTDSALPVALPAPSTDSAEPESANKTDVHLSATVASRPESTTSPASLILQLDSKSASLRSAVAALAGVTVVTAPPSDLLLYENDGKAVLQTAAGDPILATRSDDPQLLRRISAEVWLRLLLAGTTAKLGLRAETDPGSRGGTFIQCEQFVFNVALQQPAYITLLNLDAKGRLNLLYPARKAEIHAIAPHQAQALPGTHPRDRITVTPPFGLDLVAVIATSERPVFLEKLLGTSAFATASPRAQALAEGFAAIKDRSEITLLPVRAYAAMPLRENCGQR